MRYGILVCIFCVVSSFAMVQLATAQSFGVPGQLKPQDGSLYNSVELTCSTVKTKLSKIHENDGLTRVNAGQVFDSMANRLMTRLNSKIAEQRLDGGKLFTLASEFEQHLVRFREAYRVYEISMAELLKTDCDTYPQNFYYLLDSVRSERQAVQDEVTALHTAAKQYKEEVINFAEQFSATEATGESDDAN